MPRTLPDDPLPWKVLSSEYVSRKFWNTVRLEKVERPNGALINADWVTEVRPWVNVLPSPPRGHRRRLPRQGRGAAAPPVPTRPRRDVLRDPRRHHRSGRDRPREHLP